MYVPWIFHHTIPNTVDDRRLALLDVDKTIRVGSRRPFPIDGSDFMLLPFVASKIAHLNNMGYIVAMVSNQAGIHHNLVSKENVIEGMHRTIEKLQASDSRAKIHYYDFSEGYDRKRKPAKGMAVDIFHALEDSGFTGEISERLVVGDAGCLTSHQKNIEVNSIFGPKVLRARGEDAEFAQRIGASFIPAADFFGWRSLGIDGFSGVDEVKAFNSVHEHILSSLTADDRDNTKLAFDIDRSMNREDLIRNVFPSGDLLYVSRSLMQRVHPDKNVHMLAKLPYLQEMFLSAFQKVRDVYQRTGRKLNRIGRDEQKYLINEVYFRTARRNPFYRNVDKHNLEKTGFVGKFYRDLYVSKNLRHLALNLFAHFTARDTDVLLKTIRRHETILDTDTKAFLLILKDRLLEKPGTN